MTYTPARPMMRGHTSNRYRAMLEVEYANGEGEAVTTTVQFLTIHPHDIPKAGDQIRICRGLSGMVTHPNGMLIGIGGGAAVIGGLFLFMFFLTWLSLKRKG